MTQHDAAQQLEIEDLARNFDLYDAHLNKCPFETLAHMRSQAPVHHTEANGGHWVVVAYQEVNEAARDRHRFTSTAGIVIGDTGPRKFAPIEYDPPLHSEFRNLMSPFFTKQAAKAYEQPLSEYADHLIDAFAAKGEADLTESYAKPLAGHIFFTLMFDLPLALAQQCYAATNDAMFSNDKDTRLAGFAKVGEHSLRIIRERKGRPSDGGLIDTIRTGVIDGRPITDEESAGAIQTLFLGGHDTMIHAMAAVHPAWTQSRHPGSACCRSSTPAASGRGVVAAYATGGLHCAYCGRRHGVWRAANAGRRQGIADAAG